MKKPLTYILGFIVVLVAAVLLRFATTSRLQRVMHTTKKQTAGIVSHLDEHGIVYDKVWWSKTNQLLSD